MGSLSIWHWLIVGAVVLLVFGGRNKISDMMGDVARGIKAFKKGMADDETADKAAKSDAGVKTLDHQVAAPRHERATIVTARCLARAAVAALTSSRGPRVTHVSRLAESRLPRYIADTFCNGAPIPCGPSYKRRAGRSGR